ncbi:MAG: tetratricopeptide repeat protein [Deltaproteobacteria bacterium]|nr:tetratricopeptide repeat protein [Deltaproteobacteria bacterium]
MTGAKTVSIAIALLVFGGWNPFLKQNADVKSGNEEYSDGKFDQALLHYENATKSTRESPESRFNRGDALYKQGKFDEARDDYVKAAAGGDRKFKSSALYNLGNTFAKGGRIQEAIDAYIKSLMLDPKNADAKFNLELLLKREEEPQQQQQQQQQQQDPLDKMKEQEKPMPRTQQQVKQFEEPKVEKDW